MPPWMKLWPDKLLTPEFFMLPERARGTLVIALTLCGRFKDRGVAMTVADLQVFTGIPLAKQVEALQQLAARGFVALHGDRIEIPLYDEMQRPRSTTERQREWRERNDERNGKSNDTVTQGTGVHNEPRNAGVTTEEQKNRDTPTAPDGAVAPKGPGRVRPEIAPVEFEPDDERRVAAVIAIEASANKSGTLAVSRVLTLRSEMRAALDEFGVETWRYGMDEAIVRCKPTAYARAVTKGAKKRAGADVLPFAAPSRGRGSAAPSFGHERPLEERVGRFAELGGDE